LKEAKITNLYSKKSVSLSKGRGVGDGEGAILTAFHEGADPNHHPLYTLLQGRYSKSTI